MLSWMSHPRLTPQSCSRHQLNHLGRKATSESTFDQKLWSIVQSVLAGYQIIDFTSNLSSYLQAICNFLWLQVGQAHVMQSPDRPVLGPSNKWTGRCLPSSSNNDENCWPVVTSPSRDEPPSDRCQIHGNHHHYHHQLNVHFPPNSSKVWTAASQQHEVDNRPLVTLVRCSFWLKIIETVHYTAVMMGHWSVLILDSRFWGETRIWGVNSMHFLMFFVFWVFFWGEFGILGGNPPRK